MKAVITAAIGVGALLVLAPVLLYTFRRVATVEVSARHRVALLSAAATAITCVTAWPWVLTAVGVLIVILGVPAALVDAVEHRIPNMLSLPLAAGTGVALLVGALLTGASGQWWRALLGGAIWGGLLLLSFALTGDPGPGDVKLALSLGMVLNWWGWSWLIAGIALSYILAALLALAGLLSGRLRMRDSRIPMGMPMLAAAVAVATAAALA
ncbi:prepilin peptidase [Amycolatopsis aidingensis]|uniref:prepilin peptidase n=1 Tax=Amycolatopsis aidingensis TaxID=2842453 RepID=UPI001C0B36D0|nr:prepilin peptidase [Amycolatopsis aidingensis]